MSKTDSPFINLEDYVKVVYPAAKSTSNRSRHRFTVTPDGDERQARLSNVKYVAVERKTRLDGRVSHEIYTGDIQRVRQKDRGLLDRVIDIEGILMAELRPASLEIVLDERLGDSWPDISQMIKLWLAEHAE